MGEEVDMERIKRPMKAPTDVITNEELEQLSYPLVGSPKLDGFRCTVTDQPYTSSMKPFQNAFVRQELSSSIYAGLDGEIVVGDPKSSDAFHNTSGPIRRFNGEPDFKFYVFDNFSNLTIPYQDRWLFCLPQNYGRIIVLEQRYLNSPEEVLAYEQEMLDTGFEGAMIRSLTGRYKEGRCTFNEKNIFKRKPFVETEAVIVSLEEQMTNYNEAVIDERGLTKRSHCKENMFPANTLGKFVLMSPLWQKPFSAAAGKGFTAEIKQIIWNHSVRYVGEVVTIKYQKHGSRDAPRLPSVIKLRPRWDMTND